MDTLIFTQLQEGAEVNGYKLLKKIGEGGMAEVWYAENKIKKPAAIKILREDLALNKNIADRFKTEADVMVGLNHIHIRQVYDYSTINSRPCIIMEYLEGFDLKEMLNTNKNISKKNLYSWWNQIIDALNYTHEKGIVHRDIKPSNIFITNDGQLKLLDFGIAKVKDSISATRTGTQMGTLLYMSPEQVKESKNVDFYSDYYSLGVTFYHLLLRKSPYDNSKMSQFDIMESIINKPLSGVNNITGPFKKNIINATHKVPNKRTLNRILIKSKRPPFLVPLIIILIVILGTILSLLIVDKMGSLKKKITSNHSVVKGSDEPDIQEGNNDTSNDEPEPDVNEPEPVVNEPEPLPQNPSNRNSDRIQLPAYTDNPELYVQEAFNAFINESDINKKGNSIDHILRNFANNAQVKIKFGNTYSLENANEYFTKLMFSSGIEKIEILNIEYNNSNQVSLVTVIEN
jgi:serine/threonine protein kinase